MNKESLTNLAALAAVSALFIGPAVLNEQPEAVGHTDLSSGEAWGAAHPGDNYAVFQKDRVIYIITPLLSVELKMKNGQLMHVTHVMKTGNILTDYVPASPPETALWRRYFG